VSAAFECPPFLASQDEAALQWEDWATEEELLEAEDAEHVPARSPAQAAARAAALLRLQRLQLARTRLLIAGGAPDVGKTTLLRETFGFHHLQAGLSKQGQTDQIAFLLHPEGDARHRPVYAVDTPGFGDGEYIHRNDMVRLLLGAGTWIPGGVTLLWVVKAGRNVRQEADQLLRSMCSQRVEIVVVVTHMDQFFEERYREVGPRWRESFLQGVPHKDERWEAQRQTLMGELRAEVEAGVETVIGDKLQGELLFACLGGWMARSEEADHEDEFSQAAPWPWARRELTSFFNILGPQDLRTWLDRRLGLLS